MAMRISSILRNKFDVAVLGGGPAGYACAIRAAQLGLNTVCVEKRGSLGGTCLNVGCIPSKTLLHISHQYHDAAHTMKKNGIIAENVTFDLKKAMRQKNKAIRGLTKGIEGLLQANGVTYIKGGAAFADDTGKNVKVALIDGGEDKFEADNIVIAVGSKVAGIPGFPSDIIDEKVVVSSTGALEFDKVPESLAVVGGGVIGLELGSVWSRLGAKTEVVEFMPRICPAADEEVSKKFQKILTKQGLSFNMESKVVALDRIGGGVALTYEKKDGSKTVLETEKVLVSTGRLPNTTDLGMEHLNCELNRIGQIPVNGNLVVDQSSGNKNIFAVGDCVTGPMLAHKAEEDGIFIAEQIAKGEMLEPIDYKAIPSVVYTHPEVAWVGKTEEQLKAEGIKYKKSSFPMMANSRARAMDDGTEGFVKILSSDNNEILGAHMIMQMAGDVIMPLVHCVQHGQNAEQLAHTCFAHPSVSEAVKEAAMHAAKGKFIHMP